MTAWTGPVGGGARDRGRELVVEALRHIGERADVRGTLVAIETAGHDPKVLKGLLEEVGCPMLRVCYDPAELVMRGGEALGGVEALAEQIVLARARDAVGPGAGGSGREVALGQGEVDLAEYLGMLAQAGYEGAPIVGRRGGEDPIGEIAAAKERLERLLGR